MTPVKPVLCVSTVSVHSAVAVVSPMRDAVHRILRMFSNVSSSSTLMERRGRYTRTTEPYQLE